MRTSALASCLAAFVSASGAVAPNATLEAPGNSLNGDDFAVHSITPADVDGHPVLMYDVTVADQVKARALGYRRVHAWFDPSLQTLRQATFYDTTDHPVMTIHVVEFALESKAPRIRQAEMIDYRSGRHTTPGSNNSPGDSATRSREFFSYF